MQAVSEMAREVWDFHNRWGFGSGHFEDTNPANIIDRRKAILAEEVRELAEAVDEDDTTAICNEAADVLFVAIGHIEALAPKALTASDTSPPKTQTKPSKPTQFGKTPESCCQKKANHTSGSDPAIAEEL